MEREDRSMLVLAVLAVLAILVVILFPGIIQAVFLALGMVLCCFVTLIAAIAIIVTIATFFSIPFVAMKHPRKEYYGDYRIEDVKGMDEDEENRSGKSHP